MCLEWLRLRAAWALQLRSVGPNAVAHLDLGST